MHWEGMQNALEGDRIGLLLDLGQGSVTVYKNGQRLGNMRVTGVFGPLCWAVSAPAHGSSSVGIESAPAPASPTDEELAAARAGQDATLKMFEALAEFNHAIAALTSAQEVFTNVAEKRPVVLADVNAAEAVSRAAEAVWEEAKVVFAVAKAEFQTAHNAVA
jgi:hypothetical protein